MTQAARKRAAGGGGSTQGAAEAEVKGGRAGGSATFAGTDMQASVAALMAVHILARQKLNWLELPVPDVPTVLLGETLGPGDDIRVELANTTELLEVQSKKGLKKDKRLTETFQSIAEKLPGLPHVRVIIAVDSVSTSRKVRDDLKRDLVRMSDGRTDKFSEIAEYVRGIVTTAGAPAAVLDRVGIMTVDVAHNGEGNAALAIQTLRMILEDSSHAEAAWSLLVRECGLMCRDQRRLPFDNLAALLSRNGFPLQKAHMVGEGSGAPVTVESSTATPTADEAVSAAVVSTTASPDAKVARVQTMLDVAKDLLEKGSDAAALELLTDLERRNKRTSLPPEVRASLYSRLGAALMRSARWMDARKALVRALQHDERHIGALTNLGIIESYEGNKRAALQLLDKAIAVTPDSAAAWAARTRVASRLGMPNEPPETLLKDPVYLNGVASNAMAEGNWQVAAAHARQALRFGRSVDTLMIYAVSRFNESYDARIEDTPPSTERSQVLHEVLDVTAEVIELLGDEPQSRKLGDAFVLRGTVKRSMRDYAAAAGDLLRALEVDRANAEAAYQLAIVRAKQEDWTGVLSAAEMIVSGETGGRGRLLVMKARALLLLDRHDEVEAVLVASLDAARGTAQEMEVRVNGADVAIAAGLLSAANGMIAGVTDAEEQWVVHLWRARIAVKEGSPEIAEEKFSRAMETAAPADKRFVTGEFAMYLARRGESLRAIALFQAINVEDDGANPDWPRLYMRALYDADELTRLDAFLSLLRTRGPLPPWAMEMDWRIGRRQEDLGREVQALEGLRKFDASDADWLIYLADAYEKQNRAAESQALVDLAGAQRENLTATQLVNLADITARLGNGRDAVRFAFDALRRDPSDPAIHMAYLNSMLRPEHQGLTFDVDVVDIDTAVTLRGTKKFADEEYTYVLLDRADVDARRNEYRPTEPAVGDLIGRRVGDEVVRRKGAPSQEVLVVKEINHVFVHVVRDVMNNFARRFPENTALQQFKIGESPTVEDFAPLIQTTAARAEQAELAIKLHVEQCMPLSSVAGAIGSKEASLMEELTRSKSRVLHVERGGPTQLEASLQAARPDVEGEGGVVVLTRSALFTSQEMELLTIVKQMRQRLVVPGSLIEEIKGEIADLSRGLESGLKHMVTAGDSIRIVETSSQQVRDDIANREWLLKWLEENAGAMPRPVASLKSDRDKFRELLGESAFDALALAAELEGVVYADDVGLRELGANEWGVGGFSTFTLATVAAERGVIDAAKRDDVVIGLIDRNHYFIPLRAEFLEHVLARNGYEINAQVLRVLDRLADKHLIVEFGAIVVADLLRQLSTGVAGPSVLRPVTVAALEALTRGRDVMRVARQVEIAVRERMVLLPQRLDEILVAMQAFVQSRLGVT